MCWGFPAILENTDLLHPGSQKAKSLMPVRMRLRPSGLSKTPSLLLEKIGSLTGVWANSPSRLYLHMP